MRLIDFISPFVSAHRAPLFKYKYPRTLEKQTRQRRFNIATGVDSILEITGIKNTNTHTEEKKLLLDFTRQNFEQKKTAP